MAGPKQQPKLSRASSLNRLLHVSELIEQTLEIKHEAVYAFPFFLQEVMQTQLTHKELQSVIALGSVTVRQIRQLHAVLFTLGGRADDEFSPSWREPSDPISNLLFEEKLVEQLLVNVRDILKNGWDASSSLKTWLQQRINELLRETRKTTALLDRLFVRPETPYQNRVHERFRLTATP